VRALVGAVVDVVGGRSHSERPARERLILP